VSFVLAPLAVVLAVLVVVLAVLVLPAGAAAVVPPLLPVLLPVPPQPALITATMATVVRAASGRSVLLMVSPLVC
jgi:hypothetical protein